MVAILLSLEYATNRVKIKQAANQCKVEQDQRVLQLLIYTTVGYRLFVSEHTAISVAQSMRRANSDFPGYVRYQTERPGADEG